MLDIANRAEQLLEAYMAVVSDHFDAGGLMIEQGLVLSTGIPRWFICLLPEAIYDLISVAAIRDGLTVRTVDRLWLNAARHYSGIELFRIFDTLVDGKSLQKLFSPTSLKTARKSVHLDVDARLLEALVPLGAVLYTAFSAQCDNALDTHTKVAICWSELNDGLLRRLVMDGHLTGVDRDLMFSKDLGL